MPPPSLLGGGRSPKGQEIKKGGLARAQMGKSRHSCQNFPTFYFDSPSFSFFYRCWGFMSPLPAAPDSQSNQLEI